jgi:hypothetical protein
MPSAQAVGREELPPTGSRKPDDVFQVRGRRRQRAGDRGIERSARGGKRKNGRDAGANLEAAVEDVLVRHQVTQQMKE